MRKSEIHMHSTFSDGEFTPTELVGIARKNGVSILFMTEHGTFEGSEEFVQAGGGSESSGFRLAVTAAMRTTDCACEIA